MNRRKIIALLGIASSTIFLPSLYEVHAETKANVSIANYRVENVTDEGFDFIIKFNSDIEVTGLGLPYWKNGNYGGMQNHNNVERIGYNEFKAHIKMRDIGSGTEYVYVGIHPRTSQGGMFLTDLTLKLDTVNPNLNLNLSNSNWTNQNININAQAKDNMNIIEKIYFTDKNANVSNENLYSNPKFLVINGYDNSIVADVCKNNPNATIVSGSSINSVNQLKGYDFVVYDGRYWSVDNSVATILNQAFEEGVSLITNMNDGIGLLSIGAGSDYNIGGNYTFTNNIVGGGYFAGRVNRFAYRMDGGTESDNHWNVRPGTNAFTISNVTHSDNSVSSGVLFKTHSNGNKWIHSHTKDLFVTSGAFKRAIDEIMSGTMKARQTYNKSFSVSENGTYYVEVEDFSGNKTKKPITVSNIDKVNPTATITGNPTNWSSSATLQVNASDSLSGVKQIILPNGNIVNGSTASFTTNKNGTYQFRIIDNAGNEITQSVTVNKIDNSIPNLINFKTNMEMINSSNSQRKLKATYNQIVDSESGLKGYSYVLDKNPNTIPDNNVNTTTNQFDLNINENAVYYLHIKAIDNVGNTSNVIHHKIDIPNLIAQVKPTENKIRLDWTLNDLNNKSFKVFQKKPGSNDFQSISATNLDKNKQVKVLNIHPNVGGVINYTTWDGEVMSTPLSANLKQWMEMPNAEHPKGYGQGVIEVTLVTQADFNSNPQSYLKNADGTWKYDVVYQGHWDCNNGQNPNDTALNLFREFIDDGRGFLAGHDTIGYEWGTTTGLGKIRDLFNIKVGYWGNPNISTDEGHHYKSGYVSPNVKINKTGLLTNYPWNIGDIGTVLTAPQSHSTSNFAYGDIWMTYPENAKYGGYNAPAELDKYANFYLTTYNNTAMVQTGHSNAQATADEQKILANTLFYLNQLSTDNFLEDNSGQDVDAPNKPTINNHTFNGNNITFNFTGVEDNGSNYEYYVESQSKDNDNGTLSNVVKNTITSGLKGYSYVIDNKSNTIPDNNINTTSTSITTPIVGNDIYLHLKAIDNVGNASETVHYRIVDTAKPILNITGNPTTWTNQNVVLNISATDSGTGIKEIVLPNGNKITNSSTTYTIYENGSYTFKAIDKIGNETTQTIVVDKLDKTINNISNDKSTMEIVNADKNERKIKFSFNGITDNISGLKGYSYVLDKNPNTMPDNNVNTTSTNIEQVITDSGVYYLHIKGIDNAGNISNIIHHKIDIPTLKSEVKVNENKIRLDWTMGDKNDKTFKVYQKKPGSNEFQTISMTDIDKSKQVKVLNLYPNSGAIIPTYTTWDGETISNLPLGASLKKWMEEPNSENPKGYGMGLIEVTPVDIALFNQNPNNYLKNQDGSFKYDVVMIGSYDSNGSQDLSEIGLNSLDEMISTGKGLLLGHDTANRTNLGILANKYADVKTIKLDVVSGVGDTKIKVLKNGLLTNFPWNIENKTLTIPRTHTTNQIAPKNELWMDFVDITDGKATSESVSPTWPEQLYETTTHTNNFYLSSRNNASVVQTGHSNGNATEDEQKLLANTLFYLNQLSTDNFLEDNSGQDVTAPNKPTIKNHSFTEDGFINININSVVDNGSNYEYYVEAENKIGNSETISNIVKSTITSGLKGYSYIIDDKSNTIPDNTIEFENAQSIKVKTNNQKEMYLHIKTIDNVGNESETVHYRITDMDIPTLTFELNPSSWTNGDVIITAKATDNGSGVKNITLPNGSIVNSNTATFTVNKNGIYTFKCLDYMGNEGVYSLTVTNIDKRKPTVTITNNRNWTNSDVNVTITATDE